MSENLNLPPAFTLSFPLAAEQHEVLQVALRDAANEASDYLHHQMYVGGTVTARPKQSLIMLGARHVESCRSALSNTDFDFDVLRREVALAGLAHQAPVALPITRLGWWPRKQPEIPGHLLGAELKLESDTVRPISLQRQYISRVLGNMGVGFLPLLYPSHALFMDVPLKANITVAGQEAIAGIAVSHLEKAGISELQFGPLDVQVFNAKRLRRRQGHWHTTS